MRKRHLISILTLLFTLNSFSQQGIFENEATIRTGNSFEVAMDNAIVSPNFVYELTNEYRTTPKAFYQRNKVKLEKLRKHMHRLYMRNQLDPEEFSEYIFAKIEEYKSELDFEETLPSENETPDTHADHADHNHQYELRGPGDPCTNTDIETCDFTGWDLLEGEVNANPYEFVNTSTPTSGSSQHFITNPGQDPNVPIQMVNPDGGSCSAQLGDGTGTGGLAASMSQTFLVDANNAVFTYSYAVVLQDPSGHTVGEKPYFITRMYDDNGDPIACGDYEVIAGSGADPDFVLTQVGGEDTYYKDWTTVFAPLDAYIGTNVTVEFIVGDCSQGGHFGYAYVEASCDPMELVTATPPVCDGTITISAPPGADSYLWSPNGETTQDITVSTPGTYSVELTPVTGASCAITLDTTITEMPQLPTADFSANPTTVCIGDPIDFTDASTPPAGETIDTWDWDFGDGTGTSSDQDPSYTYGSQGTYDVILTVTTPAGCTSTSTNTVTVNAAGDPTITPAGPFCLGDPSVNLSAVDPGGTWSGTGITDANNGTFDPATAGVGTHTITYTIAGSCGASDTEDIVVNDVTDATITPAGPFCIGDPSVDLSAVSPGGTWSGTGITDANNGTFDPVTAGAGTHTITYTIGGSCGDTDTEDIIVTAGSDATISPAGPFCESDASITMTAVDPGGTWSGTGIIDANTGEFDPATAGPGTHTITYDIPGGCGDTDTEDVVVNEVFDPTITQVGPYCEDDASIILTAVDAGGTWSGTGIVDANTGEFDPATAGPGTHTITYDFGAPCPISDNIDIEIIPRSDATITPAGPYCETDVVATMTGAEAGGTWSATCGACIDANTGDFDPSIAGAGTHTITYDIAGQCGDSDTEDITVDPVYDPTINPAGPFCEDAATATLSAADPGGTWSATCGTCIDANTGVFDPAVAGPGTHTINYDFGAPCPVSDNIDITVIARSDATITPAGPYCESDPSEVLTGAQPGGTWSADCGGCINAGTGAFDPAIAGPGNHTITYDLAGACGDTDDLDILVNPDRDATVDPAGPFCESDQTHVMSAAETGGTWSATCGACIDANTGVFDPAAAGPGTHTVTYTIADPCGDVQTTDVEVLPDMDATITPVGPFCHNDANVVLDAVDAGGTWSGPGIVDANTGEFSPVQAGPGTHSITYDIPGQCGDVQFTSIQVYSPLSLTALQDASICPGDDVPISAFANGGDGNYSYSWDNGVGAGANHTVSPAATTTYTASVTDGCETVTDDITITVNPLPTADLAADNLEGCSPVNTTFTEAATIQGSSCLWNFGDGTISSDCGPVDHTYTTPGCYDVSITVTSPEGCVNSITYDDYICVYANPTADFTFGPQPTSIFEPGIEFTNESSANSASYDWTFGDESDMTPSTSNAENPYVTYTDEHPGTYPACLAVATNYGCVDTTCKDVIIQDEFLIYVPNAFTPDGDGVNDFFFPQINGEEPMSFTMYIFDRWGELIYESNYVNGSWDGTYKGLMCKEDVYVWKIIVTSAVDGKKREYYGHVSLLR